MLRCLKLKTYCANLLYITNYFLDKGAVAKLKNKVSTKNVIKFFFRQTSLKKVEFSHQMWENIPSQKS